MALTDSQVASLVQNAVASGVGGAEIGAQLASLGVSQAQAAAATGIDPGIVAQAYAGGAALSSGGGMMTSATAAPNVPPPNVDRAGNPLSGTGVAATPKFTDAQVAAYIRDNKLTTTAQINQAAAQFGVGAEQLTRAQGLLSSNDPSVKAASDAYAAAVKENPQLGIQNYAATSQPTPNRPSFDDVFARWNEQHKARFNTYVNLATTSQADFDRQVKDLIEQTKQEQAAWDKQYGTTREAQVLRQEPPPNWYDIYGTWSQQYKEKFGTEVLDRPWNADADAIRQKEELDQRYLTALADYNKRNGTQVQPDVGVLGANVQPNAIFKMPEQKKKSFLQQIAPYAGLALSIAFPGAGAAIGGLAGLTGTAASVAGNAVIGGALSAAGGGNPWTGAALGGLGGALSSANWGEIGDTLSNTFADITGIDATKIKSALSSFSQPTSDAAVGAQDALTMAQNGLGTAAIQQNLVASGMDSLTAATLANNAVLPGATTQSLLSGIANQPIYTNVAGLLSGGNSFATTQQVFDNLVRGGLTGEEAAQLINTAGGGLNLGTVGVDASGKLIQTAAGTAGNLLTGATTGAAAAAGGAAAGGAASEIAKAAAGAAGGVAGQIGAGVLQGAVGVGGAMLDRAALERYAQQLQASAAQYAPQMQFQPVGITTRFGRTGTPTYDAQGRLISIGATTPAADVAAQRDRLLSLSNQALPTTTNTQQVTQDYYNQLQALQRPTDELTLAQLQNRLQATGRGGLAFGATSGAGGSNALLATNPELAAYYNALAQRQSQQALTAQDVAQQRLNQQIATSGTLFGQGRDIEALIQQPTQLSLQFGQQATSGSRNAALSQLEAAISAAELQATGARGVNRALTSAAAGAAPAIGTAVGTAIGNLF
jgi:YD repeat-containing protein